jgi:hypothetical protein
MIRFSTVRMSVTACSATETTGADGVLNTRIPRSAAAARSTESRPTPHREITARGSDCSMTWRVKGSVPAITPTGCSDANSPAASTSDSRRRKGLVTTCRDGGNSSGPIVDTVESITTSKVYMVYRICQRRLLTTRHRTESLQRRLAFRMIPYSIAVSSRLRSRIGLPTIRRGRRKRGGVEDEHTKSDRDV